LRAKSVLRAVLMSIVLSPVELAYAAGILDGEGCICVRQHSRLKSTKVEVTVGMCNTVIPDWLLSIFPTGRRYTKRRQVSKNWKPCELFMACNLQAVPILTQLLPYLKLKKRQAELALELNALKREGRGRHKANYPRELEIHNEVRALNKRGLK
jgi:hypothetical protein